MKSSNRETSAPLWLPTLVSLLTVGIVAAGPSGSVSPRPVHVTIPHAVRSFFVGDRSALEADLKQIRDEDTTFSPAQSLLFYDEVPASAPEDSPKYLIGYRLGHVGQGRVPINRCAIVDQFGRVEWRFKDALAGDDGLVFRLDKDRWAVAMSYGEGLAEHRGRVKVFVLGRDARELLSYDCPRDQNWYSTLYCGDIDGDGAADLLVDRTIRRGSTIIAREFAVTSWDGDESRFKPWAELSGERFRQSVDRSGGSLSAIKQHGPPYADHTGQ